MIHYYVNSKRRSVIGVLKDTGADAIQKMRRTAGVEYLPYEIEKAAIMPSEFRVEVVCHPEDEFDEKIGRKLVKKRILDNHSRSMDKARKRAGEAAKVYMEKLNKIY